MEFENEYLIKNMKKRIQDSNINFLIGSGMSMDFLQVLGDIETELSKDNLTKDEEIKAKRSYYDGVMLGNLDILNEADNIEKDKTLKNYTDFYKIWNHILLQRKSTILSKQINIFTTNIDIFSEKALEKTKLELNDGFGGKFNQVFDIGNFKKSLFRKSLHYENTTEIPVFNLLKIHGSLTWKKKNNIINFDRDLSLVDTVNKQVSDEKFLEKYTDLMIVNPAKTKFKDTLLNQYYYDLLRIYSNELEKENSVLLVLGFSFADEHIKDLTIRVADSNPTLQVYIFSYGETPRKDILEVKDNAKNKNIEIIKPKEGENKYDFSTINEKIFSKLTKYEEFDNTIIPDNKDIDENE